MTIGSSDSGITIHQMSEDKTHTKKLAHTDTWEYGLNKERPFTLDSPPPSHTLPTALLPSVSDQKRQNTCVAHAISRAVEFESGLAALGGRLDALCWHSCTIGLKPSEPLSTVSAAATNSNYRRLPNHPNPASGGRWQCESPTIGAVIDRAERFSSQLDLRRWLSMNHVAVGVVGSSQEFADHKGTNPFTSDDEPIGQHCVLLIGYRENAWQIQNSAGTGWGDNGRGWIEATTSKLLSGDLYPAYRIYSSLPD